jgi:uncharacterized protein with FMN-binding domain
MKASPGIVLAGTAAGFAGVLGLHILATIWPSAGTAVVAGAQPQVAGPPARHGAAPGAGRDRRTGGLLRGATGASIQFGYGTLAVRVTVRGSRIANVAVAALQTLEPTSQAISEQAIPVLRSEVLAAQSANVHAVTGASYTSLAYMKSVQAALDALHVS